MGIVVGGMRADTAEEGAEAEHKPDPEITEEEKRGKLLTIHKWKLAQVETGTSGKGGGTEWEGLALFMDKHKLHSIALQELRISDQTTFMSSKHKYKGLTLLMYPCIEV